jgi:predicted RNase H-like nuclease (RuvC/YqgF family)
MTLKAYAVKNKMSLFQVIKAVRNGSLPSETVVENGKEVTYVIVESRELEEESPDLAKETQDETVGLKEEIEALKSEIKLLKREMERLRKKIGAGAIL